MALVPPTVGFGFPDLADESDSDVLDLSAVVDDRRLFGLDDGAGCRSMSASPAVSPAPVPAGLTFHQRILWRAQMHRAADKAQNAHDNFFVGPTPTSPAAELGASPLLSLLDTPAAAATPDDEDEDEVFFGAAGSTKEQVAAILNRAVVGPTAPAPAPALVVCAPACGLPPGPPPPAAPSAQERFRALEAVKSSLLSNMAPPPTVLAPAVPVPTAKPAAAGPVPGVACAAPASKLPTFRSRLLAPSQVWLPGAVTPYFMLFCLPLGGQGRSTPPFPGAAVGRDVPLADGPVPGHPGAGCGARHDGGLRTACRDRGPAATSADRPPGAAAILILIVVDDRAAAAAQRHPAAGRAGRRPDHGARREQGEHGAMISVRKWVAA